MNPTQYLAESSATASNNFHSDKVDSLILDEALESLVNTVSEQLDPIKKALFYGKVMGEEHAIDVNEYGHIPIHLIDPNSDKAVAILHTILGIITEAGELGELLLAVLRGEKKFDDANFLEELGDGQWYTAMGLRTIQHTFENCFDVNIKKLRKRFPDGFTEFDAQLENRNLPEERKILEAGARIPMEQAFREVEGEALLLQRANGSNKHYAKMENWVVSDNRLFGDLTAHSRIGAGRDARTSRLLESNPVSEFRPGGIVETVNTVYLLGQPG